jgi:hypothetical protein
MCTNPLFEKGRSEKKRLAVFFIVFKLTMIHHYAKQGSRGRDEFMQTNGSKESEITIPWICRLGNTHSFDNRDSAVRTIEEQW